MTGPELHPVGDRSWREALEAARASVRASDVPVPALDGKLLRPRLAWILLPPDARSEVGEAFAHGALAIQMAHEASLLHDDILDGAATRRGRTSTAADRGIGFALVLGDHYLTSAYRVAAKAGPEFLHAFIEAVERTVGGEAAQARSAGRPLEAAAYRDLIRRKSGELFGAAAVLAALERSLDPAAARALGRDVGALYQMVDDVLDYCPGAATGKTAFQDYRQRKHTFVLAEADILDFDAAVEEVEARLFEGGRRGALGRAVACLEEEAERIALQGGSLFGHDGSDLRALLGGWVQEAWDGIDAHLAARDEAPRPAGTPSTERDAAPSHEALVAAQARAVGDPEAWGRYFGRHSKSFRFAARLFPPEPRSDVEGVYAFCRFTDDLVDEARVPPDEARARLEAWREIARAAYDGTDTGIPLADVVMSRMAEGRAPFHYADDLLTGVGMDLSPTRYETVEELEGYTYRVAGVVGGWITELFGVHEPAVLRRAYAMGHAMQLTNILRDVGEDWRRGRCYLPRDLMVGHGVGDDDLATLAEDGAAPERYAEMLEELMAAANAHYQAAFEAIPLLPTWYRRPVAVAARVYQGIHDEIRRNGYDNGRRRAHTSLLRKVRLGAGALRELRRLSREPRDIGTPVVGALASRDGGGTSVA